MYNDYIFPILSEKDLRLPFFVATVGMQEHQTQINRPRGIEHHQLLITKTGVGTAVLSGGTVSLSPASILYYPPNTPHLYAPETMPWETLWITFGRDGVFSVLGTEGGIYKTNNLPGIEALHRDICRLNSTLNWQEQASVLLYQLLLCVKSEIDYGKSGALEQRLRPSIDYMKRHLASEIELSDLAACCNISRAHYCRLFKLAYGQRPFELLLRLRLQKAKTLLLSAPGKDIAEVALECGFHSVSYFIQLFKKEAHKTPSAFRQFHLGK